MQRTWVTIDGNEAVATIAHSLSEVIAIYPITPSTPMGELSDAWSAEGRANLWGTVPQVIEMQSEAGAAGAIHGALQTGALVMATRATGYAMLASNSVQEAQDLALIAHASSLKSRVPFVHFFDGFRTSHEVGKIEQLTREDIRAMIDDSLVQAHRQRALSPDHPFIRGTSQNPDVYFQSRETVNRFYVVCPTIVQEAMDSFASLIGRHYHLFDYVGAPDAERVIVIMGSGAETVESTVKYLTAQEEKVGVVKVRLFRPFSVEHFLQVLPKAVKVLAVLDRTKEPGSTGEPLSSSPARRGQEPVHPGLQGPKYSFGAVRLQ